MTRIDPLLAAVHRPEDLPRRGVPIVAFAGRSNVGKSSLLNRLLGVAAARTSRTPGRTQGIYLYDSDKGWIAADLPGFGFARRSKTARESWAVLAAAFFEGEGPHLTAQLIDPRIPTSEFDLEFRDYLRGLSLPSICVATKADRMKRTERAEASRRLEREFGPVHFVSSRTGEGVEQLKRKISQALADGGRESRINDGKTT